MPTADDPRARLIAKFRAITLERLQRITDALQHLEEEPGDEAKIAELMREIHTVKGESKIMGFPEINSVAHRTEDILVLVRKAGFESMERGQRDHILAGMDLISGLIEADDAAEFGAQIEAFLGSTDAAEGAKASSGSTPAAKFAPAAKHAPAAKPAPAARPARAATPKSALEARLEAQAKAASQQATADAAKGEPVQTEAAEEPAGVRGGASARDSGGGGLRSQSEDFVRVSGDQLAALTALSGDLLVRQDQFDRMIAEVDTVVGRWQATLAQLAGLTRPSGESESVDTEVASLELKSVSRLTAIGRELAGTVVRAREDAFENRLHLGRLQESVRDMRLLDFAALFNRLPRAIRELAREQGKSVRVRVEGADVAVDKQVLDQLDEPLLHLIRNAVDHGLESPDERRAQRKPVDAEIRLIAEQVGGHVEVTIADDGRGIDPRRVKRAAVSKGLLSEDEAAQLTEADSTMLLFRSGFSTREQTTDISGRGIGLDVVSEKVDSLGGEVRVESDVGRGTRFVLRVPISVALTKALVVGAGEGLYALPSVSVLGALRVPRAEIERKGQTRALLRDGERVPLISLSDVVGAPRVGGGENFAEVVLVQHAGQRVALEVERFAGERELVRQALDPFLIGLGLISGTALLGGRRLVLFLHLPDLYRRALSGQGAQLGASRAVVAGGRATILVVDDSELTRVMLVSIIERLGYRSVEAVNGAEGLRTIERSRPNLVLTDLDMPVMDGFTFIERVRQDANLRDVPIIVMSTRGAEEDKKRAMDVGANAYLVKTEFQEVELHRTFKLYLSAG